MRLIFVFLLLLPNQLFGTTETKIPVIENAIKKMPFKAYKLPNTKPEVFLIGNAYGVSRSGRRTFLLVSKFNPEPIEDPNPSLTKRFFAGKSGRPRTYESAKRICEQIKVQNLQFSIPNNETMELADENIDLQNIRERIHNASSSKKEAARFAPFKEIIDNTFERPMVSGPQFNYYWTNLKKQEKDLRVPGIEYALHPGLDLYILHSTSKPINFFCVAKYQTVLESKKRKS